MKEIQVNIPIPELFLDSTDRPMIEKALQFFHDGADGGMSYYQITNFVLSDKEFPTPASKVFQAVREMYVRFENLVNQQFEFQKVEANAEIKQCECDDLMQQAYQTPLVMAKAKLARVERDQLVMRLEFIKKEAKRQLRELKAFWENHQYYVQQLKPGVNKEVSEPEFWALKALEGDKIMAEWEKTKVGEKPHVLTRQDLDGPMAAMRAEIIERNLKDDILRLKSLPDTPPVSLNGHKEG